MFYCIILSGIFYNIAIKYTEKACCRKIHNSKSRIIFIRIYINLFKYLKDMSRHKNIKYLQHQIIRLRIYSNFRFGIMKEAQEKCMPASLYELVFISGFHTGTYVTCSLFIRNILLISECCVKVCKTAIGIFQSQIFSKTSYNRQCLSLLKTNLLVTQNFSPNYPQSNTRIKMSADSF